MWLWIQVAFGSISNTKYNEVSLAVGITLALTIGGALNFDKHLKWLSKADFKYLHILNFFGLCENLKKSEWTTKNHATF